MDAATLLDHFTHDFANLPEETKFMLEEVRKKDMELDKIMSQIQHSDSQLLKYIKQHGSIVRHPKEDQIVTEIEKNYAKAKQIQDDKILLSNTILLSISKHSAKVDHDIRKLMESGAIENWDVTDNDIEMIDEISVNNSVSADSLVSTNLTKSSRFKSPSVSTNSRSNTNTGSQNDLHDLSKKLNNSSLDSKSQRNNNKKSSRGVTPSSPFDDSINTETSSSRVASTPSSRRKEAPTSNTLNKGPRRVPSRGGNNENGTNNGADDDEIYCFCRQVSYGEMVGCDNANCRYEWFHYDCVGLTEPPVGAWFCPDCSKDMKKDVKSEKKKKK